MGSYQGSSGEVSSQLSFEQLQADVDKSANLNKKPLAPMLAQYVQLKEEYPDHILLFQVGDFFEVFFEDAKLVADVLSIRLTSRDKDQTNPTPMCGVPIHALDNYLPKLLVEGLSCVVMSQVEEAGARKGPVKREITRIVTPGVRYEGDGLDEKRFNYLAALCSTNNAVGAVSFIDVSTGHLRVEECDSNESLEEVLRRISPSEIVLPNTLFDVAVNRSESWLSLAKKVANDLNARVVRRPFAQISRDALGTRLNSLINPDSGGDGSGGRASGVATQLEGLSPGALSALAAAIDYVEEVSFSATPRLSRFSVEQPQSSVFIDYVTRRNLELTESRLDSDRKHSLLNHLDLCKTAMGSRLLAERLCAPSCDLKEINTRHDALEELIDSQESLELIRQVLIGVRDLDRLVSKVTSKRVTPSDLSLLAKSLEELPLLKNTIANFSSDLLASIAEQLDPLEDVCQRLFSALSDSPPVRISEGNIFQQGYNEQLDHLRDIRANGKQWLTNLENSEKAKTGISGLRVKYNNVFGYFIEISKVNLSKVPSHYERKQTLTNSERFITEELKEHEVEILSAKAKQIDLERELFVELRTWIASQSQRIQGTSRLLSELDVLSSLSYVAIKNNYCRPQLNDTQELRISNGRHPVVEKVLGAHNFIPNDTYLNGSDQRFAILTGPNMGGKSTYLRQIGLIQLLAQVGSYVPAESAELGVADRIFTRIGAADDLSRGDSTFMVEMREVATIVQKATSSSLVLIDEVGRGTATSDGLAIATAVAEWLIERIACRTVFATHFHRMTQLSEVRDGAHCLSVGVIEKDGEISFTHRIEHRPADRSYGIEVARLAGLPEKLLRRAAEVLEAVDEQAAGAVPLQVTEVDSSKEQLTDDVRAVLDRLSSCKTDSITPLQALTELNELKQLIDS